MTASERALLAAIRRLGDRAVLMPPIYLHAGAPGAGLLAGGLMSLVDSACTRGECDGRDCGGLGRRYIAVRLTDDGWCEVARLDHGGVQ